MMMKRIGLRILAAVLLVVFSQDAIAQKVHYKKGRLVENRIESGGLVRTDFGVDLLTIAKDYCGFRISYVQFRERLVTPLFQEIRVTETEVYDPSAGELLADIISIPFIPIKALIGQKAAGTHWKIDKVFTGRLIKGETRTDGLVEGLPEMLSGASISLMVNRFSIEQGFVSDSHGILRIPSEIIAEAYLVDGLVDMQFQTQTFRFEKAMDKKDLERILKQVYRLD